MPGVESVISWRYTHFLTVFVLTILERTRSLNMVDESDNGKPEAQERSSDSKYNDE